MGKGKRGGEGEGKVRKGKGREREGMVRERGTKGEWEGERKGEQKGLRLKSGKRDGVKAVKGEGLR